MRYTFPNSYAEEKPKLEGPIQATASGFGGMQAITAKGPVGVPLRHRNFESWKKVFGERESTDRGDAAYEANLFFEEGGFELITQRQVHYADIADISSFTGGVASRTSITDASTATAASVITLSSPYVLADGDTLDLDVDNVGVANIVFNATPGGVLDTTVYPIADQDGLNFGVSVDGGAVQTITFAGVTTALVDVIAQVNAQIDGAKAIDNGGQLEIISDKEGTGSSISVTAGTSTLTFAAPTAGTGDAADISAVTIAELKTVVEAGSDAVVVDNGDGTATIQSPTTGLTSELDIQSGSSLTALGLSVSVTNGTDDGLTYPALKMEAGYKGLVSPGVSGNVLKTQIVNNPRRPSLGAGLDLAADITAGDSALQITSYKGLEENSVIKTWDGSNTEYKLVSQVRTEVVGGVVQFWLDFETTFVNSFTAIDTQISSLEFDILVYEGNTLQETLQYNSMVDTSPDYVEAKVNDENLGSNYIVVTDLDATPGLGADFPAADSEEQQLTGGTDEVLGLTVTDWIGDKGGQTGLYAWDQVYEFMPFCTLDTNDPTVIHAAAAYAKNRLYFEYITYVDNGLSSSDAVAFRNNVVGLNNSYVSMYAGGVKIFDPEGAGSNPRRELIGLGLQMGLRSRVDSLPSPDGGPWQTPAGEGEYGTSRSALDVVTKYGKDESGDMNDVGINVIQKFSLTSPVIVWGGRTQDASKEALFRYINTRRTFQYIEKSIVDSTRWAVFRNNDFRLWDKLREAADTWLSNILKDGAFPTAIKKLAFFVKVGITDGVMDAQARDDGYVIGSIGLAPVKPGEFIVWRFSQYDSGFEVVEEV